MAESMFMKEYKPKNLSKPPLEVVHADLKREGDSLYKSRCPVCKDGILLMRRDQRNFTLQRDDYCILCGQHFLYVGNMPELPDLL